MNVPTPKGSHARKAMRARDLPRRPACRRCPHRGPWGECFATGLKSGRCGDWVWYVRNGKQQRHLYVKPKDPRTPRQFNWRARFAAASRKYSQSMTDEERDACIAAGAKLRSRSRLGQSGRLTGQQYSIKRDCARRVQEGAVRAEKAKKRRQTQEISRSTSEQRRTATGLPPGQHRGDTGRLSRNESTFKAEVARRSNARGTSIVLRPRRFLRLAGPRRRSAPRAGRCKTASNWVHSVPAGCPPCPVNQDAPQAWTGRRESQRKSKMIW